MVRPTRADIDLDALRTNLQLLRARATGKQVQAVVKADAYGHGLAEVVRALRLEVDAFAVAIGEEVEPVLASGTERPVVVLEGPSSPQQLGEFSGAAVEWVLHDRRQIEWLGAASRPIRCWVKVNVGMNRLGLEPADLSVLLSHLDALHGIEVCGIMMHFAAADEPDSAVHRAQMETAMAVVRQFPDRPVSCANSAAVLIDPPSGQALPGHWIRPGISLYGASPFGHRSAASLGLTPVMHLHSELICVRELNAGDLVGYGASWRCQRPGLMGVIPIGYADGFLRSLSNRGFVLFQGDRVPLIGRVSMDMIAIDLLDHPGARPGDPVTLWGPGLPVDIQAAAAGTLGYELLSGLGGRVPRRYCGRRDNSA